MLMSFNKQKGGTLLTPEEKGYIEDLDQSLGTTDDVKFNSVAIEPSTNITQLTIKDDASQTAPQILINDSTGTEKLRIKALDRHLALGNLAGSSLISTGVVGSTYIGYKAGEASTGHSNVCLGDEAGNDMTTAIYNTCIGARAGSTNTASGYNVYVGSTSGQGNTGQRNTAVGHNSGNLGDGGDNVFIGYSGGRLSTASRSVCVGYQCGEGNSGNDCVLLGYRAGYTNTNNNKLFIANTDTATPLIGGDFSTPSVDINGTLNVTQTLSYTPNYAIFEYRQPNNYYSGNVIGDQNFVSPTAVTTNPTGTSIVAGQFHRFILNHEAQSASWATFTPAGTGTSTTASSILLDAGTYRVRLDAGGIYGDVSIWLICTDTFTQQAGVPTGILHQDVNAYQGFSGGEGSNIYTQGIITLASATRIYVITLKSTLRSNDTNGIINGIGLDEIFARITLEKLK